MGGPVMRKTSPLPGFALAWLCLLAAPLPGTAGGPPPESARPVPLRPGPYPLLDDSLIESSTHLTRRVQSPRRDLTRPVVTGRDDKNDQPYVTVLRDPARKRFRMWYDASGDATRAGL